jgi:hypothetical protein
MWKTETKLHCNKSHIERWNTKRDTQKYNQVSSSKTQDPPLKIVAAYFVLITHTEKQYTVTIIRPEWNKNTNCFNVMRATWKTAKAAKCRWKGNNIETNQNGTHCFWLCGIQVPFLLHDRGTRKRKRWKQTIISRNVVSSFNIRMHKKCTKPNQT